jgi:UDP-glucose 4-epimerase
MIIHLNSKPLLPSRVVILGAGGFVSSAVQRRLEALNVPVLALTRSMLDLTHKDAGSQLAGMLCADDALLFVAAKAPVKTEAMLIENLQMAEAVCDALKQSPVDHVVYISSDAVYADSDFPLTECSCAQPGSLHGMMHLAREVMLANAFHGPLCFLRSTLIYGKDDPHNGYGPNSFIRLAISEKDIVLFGEGEERRDHVWVEEVAEIASRVMVHKSKGILNIATGLVVSFREIAEKISANFNPNTVITTKSRIGPMPHNGYRAFDVSVCNKVFPDFRYTAIDEGIAKFLK